MNRGFSLVELSIVLVILGLLTGGILAGQSLIRAAEIRSVSTDLQRFNTAIYTFRDKYFALPGDMTNATSFWDNADTGTTGGDCAAPLDDAGSGTQTCNGDGNGHISDLSIATSYHESLRLWQHLANAGLVEGSYTGTRLGSSNAVTNTVAGENAPKGRVGTSSYYISYTEETSGITERFDHPAGHFMLMGGTTTNSWPSTPFLSPEELWNIDTKMDDGHPAYGKVMSRKNGSSVAPNCATTDASATAEYNLLSTDKLCIFSVLLGV